MKIVAYGKLYQILIIFLIPIISLSITFDTFAYGQNENTNSLCGPGTVETSDNTCVPLCEDGTKFVEGKIPNDPGTCIADQPFVNDNQWIGVGVIIAGGAAGAGIIITVFDRKSENKKRNQELMKTYSDEIREISNQESKLMTKQDCALYTEQYLDTLEQIATLRDQEIFTDEAIRYFENNFVYGRDLWWWYNKYIHGLEDDVQDIIWRATKNSRQEKFSYQQFLDAASELVAENKIKEPKILRTLKEDAITNFLNDDRWPAYRKLCMTEEVPITEFYYDYEGIGGKTKNDWRVLPDIMYFKFDDIPDENGLSKAEFVEIIRPYANDLSEFVEKEKEMETPEQFEVYAEQYLETLEQIGTLYRNKIIPYKAKEYFENKFSYGINLWQWYHHRVLKFSNNLVEAFWETKPPKIKLEDIFNEEQLAVMTKSEQDAKQKELDEDIDTIKENTFKESKENYSKGDISDSTIVAKLLHEDPDVLKLVFAVVDECNDDFKQNMDAFIKYVRDQIKSKREKAFEIGQKLEKARKDGKVDQIAQFSEELTAAEDELINSLHKLS